MAAISTPSLALTIDAYSFPIGKGGILVNPTFDAVEGNLFQVTGSDDLLVSELGFENYNSILGTTALYDFSGNVLASANITSADTLRGGFRWKSIAPITLYSGQKYYIGSLHGTGLASKYEWNTRTATSISNITDLGTYYKVSSTIGGGFWEYGGGTSQYGPGGIRHYVGNFASSAVPEPFSIMALSAGLLFLRKRRR